MTTDTAERWCYIPDTHEFYAVSDLGRVYSYRSGKFLKTANRKSGHVHVVLYPDGNGKGWSIDVQILVLLSFVGPRPGKNWDARHANGIPNDNRLDNLEWATKTRNRQDIKHHDGRAGLKLTVEQVGAIKQRLREGTGGSALAREYGVSPSLMSAIKYGKSHNDVA